MKKVLFISFQDFHNEYNGGSQANKRNVDMAKKILGDDNVDCYYVNDINKKNTITSRISAMLWFPFGYFNGLTPLKIKEILVLSRDYDYIFINTSVFGLISKKLKEAGYRGKIITFFHNVESIYYESRVSKRLPLRNIIIGCAKKNDMYSINYSDISVGLCQRDSRIMKSLYNKSFDIIAPITFADKCTGMTFDKQTKTAKKPKCLFIGSNFPANAEGLLWFVKNILPHVDIDFQIVGKDMDILQRKNACLKDIPVYANVPDLAPFFIEADFMIYPIFSGSGMKVKTCEALMYGKNIFGTSEAFEGYEIDTEKCGSLCNTADDYIKAIERVCRQPIIRYNCYSRRVFEEKYSEECSERTFKMIFNR